MSSFMIGLCVSSFPDLNSQTPGPGPHFYRDRVPKFTQVTEPLEVISSLRKVTISTANSIVGKEGPDPILVRYRMLSF